MTRWRAVLVMMAVTACVEPRQPRPSAALGPGTSPCEGKRVRAPVSGTSPRDMPDDEDDYGYGYALEDDPLCAGGGIMPHPTPASAPSIGPSTSAAPKDSAPPVVGPPKHERALVTRCWMAAMNKLAWLEAGTHDGQFIRTALDAGLISTECEPLARDAYPGGFPLKGGGTLHWSRDDTKQRGSTADVTITFYCSEDACTPSDPVVITLPAVWHCAGWVHGPDHGDACFNTPAKCMKARRSAGGNTTPCSRHVGAAYCASNGACYPSPWSCTREHGGSIKNGDCVRADR